jgi:hypothetical protein
LLIQELTPLGRPAIDEGAKVPEVLRVPSQAARHMQVRNRRSKSRDTRMELFPLLKERALKLNVCNSKLWSSSIQGMWCLVPFKAVVSNVGMLPMKTWTQNSAEGAASNATAGECRTENIVSAELHLCKRMHMPAPHELRFPRARRLRWEVP